MGRPRKFRTAEQLSEAWEKYKEHCDNQTVLAHSFSQKNSEYVSAELKHPITYTIEGFCVFIDIPRSVFYGTYSEDKRFSDTVTRIREECETDARSKFEKGVIDPKLAGLWMSNYGYGIKNETGGSSETAKSYGGISAELIIPTFAPVIFDIEDGAHSEYVFPGGRGSTKSSFISLEIIDLLMKHEDMHACILRQVGNTLRDTVYNQILWALSVLNLENEFHAAKTPLEITRISTGQKIYFRGADDPNKLKSIKPPFGYVGIIWFEELDQFAGEESIRKIEQSVIRGGDKAYKFKSFNPPRSALNWANLYIKTPNDERLVTESNYLSVPRKWLGTAFINDAEHLRDINPAAYENEYMGVANGTGGAVFDNIVPCEITDKDISEYDYIYSGIDWGWYPDPFAYVRMTYLPKTLTLIIFDEYRCNKKSNRETADILIKEKGVDCDDLLICDSAENKSVSDYRDYGLKARPAEKFPGSVTYSMKWLQSLREIIIDPKRCPHTYKEFTEYEYERTKDGEIISGYPDRDNHSIDAVRYAMQPIWRKRGQ